MPRTEHATFRVAEIRADSDGRTVAGVAVPFGERAVGPKGVEVVVRGAFARTRDHLAASGRRLKALRNHDHAAPVGTVVGLDEQDDGLHVEIRMADTALGEETLREVRSGMLDSFSIGFEAKRERTVAGVRQLLEVALHEISLVALPAYAGARVMELRDAGPDLTAYRIPPLPASLLADVARLR